MWLRLIHISLLLLSVVVARSQMPFTRTVPLPVSGTGGQVTALHSCHREFVWLGTGSGAYVYDSYSLDAVRFPNNARPHITALAESPDHRMVAATANGRIYVIDPFTLQATLWAPDEGLPSAAISSLTFTQDGTLWFSVPGEGLYYYHHGRMYLADSDDGLFNNDIHAVVAVDDSTVLLMSDTRLYRMHANHEHKEISPIKIVEKSYSPAAGFLFTGLSRHEKGAWIITFDEGLLFYDHVRQETYTRNIHPLLRGLKSVDAASNGLLYALSELGHILEIDPDNGSVNKFPLAEEYSHPGLSSLMADAGNILWVATKGNELLGIDLSFQFTRVADFPWLSVMQINDTVLMAGSDNGLYKVNLHPKGSHRYRSILDVPGLQVLSMAVDEQGNIYAATFDHGLYVISADEKQVRHITARDGLINNSMLSVVMHGGKLWCATLGGSMSIDPGRNPFTGNWLFEQYTDAPGLGAHFIYQLYSDSKGRLWFATDGNGPVSMDAEGTFTSHAEACRENVRTVYSIAEDVTGNIWFSTPAAGIYRIGDQGCLHIAPGEGLRSSEISALIASPDSKLYILYADGIDVLDLVRGNIQHKSLSGTGFKLDHNLNAYTRHGNKTIWIAADGGFLRWHQAGNMAVDQTTRIVWKQISVNQVVLHNPERPVSVPFINHLISFHFRNVDHTSSGHDTYFYRLVGYQDAWVATKDDHVVWAGLPPGTYRFEAAPAGRYILGSAATLSFEFTILKPWWQTWWFILSAVLLAGGITYMVIRERDMRIKKAAMLKKVQVEAQFELLKNQVRPHFLFNSFNTLAGLIEENPAHAVVYVEKLADLYRNILQYREKDLIDMEEELQLLNDYYFLLQQRYGNRLKLFIDKDRLSGYIAPLTLQMMVENAVKHNTITAGKPLEINIGVNSKGQIEVSNNYNPKRQREASTEFGLRGIAERYAILAGKKVTYGLSGNRFVVNIPMIKNNGK